MVNDPPSLCAVAVVACGAARPHAAEVRPRDDGLRYDWVAQRSAGPTGAGTGV